MIFRQQAMGAMAAPGVRVMIHSNSPGAEFVAYQPRGGGGIVGGAQTFAIDYGTVLTPISADRAITTHCAYECRPLYSNHPARLDACCAHAGRRVPIAMKNYSTLYRRLQAGLSMIEVLVSLTIVAFGVLGLLGLQARALSFQRDSFDRRTAAEMVAQLAERMRANHLGLTGGLYAPPTAFVSAQRRPRPLY